MWAREGGASGDGVAGEGEFFDDVVDDGFGAHAFGFAFEGEDHAVAESGDGDGVDVFLGDVEAAFEEGACASGGEDGLGTAWAGAVADVGLHRIRSGCFGGVGIADDADEVVLDLGGDGDLAEGGTHLDDVLAGGDGVDFRGFVAGGAVEDFDEVVVGGDLDEELEEEAVELGFRERVGAFVFDGVLGGENEEGERELVGFAGHGDRFFLHGFEQGGLGFGGGAVDFVSEEDVAEDWALLEFEDLLAAFIDEDLGTDDVGGEEVRGELDPLEFEVEGLGDGVDEGGLAETGDTFEEDVAAADDGDEDIFDDVLLTDDEFADFRADFLEGFLEVLSGLFWGHGWEKGEKGTRVRRVVRGSVVDWEDDAASGAGDWTLS